MQATGFIKGDYDKWPELQEWAIGNDNLIKHPASWPVVLPGHDVSGWTPNPFYVRGAEGRYWDASSLVGLERQSNARGLATADVDGDGDLDLAVANQWEASYVYINEARESGAFLGLHLNLVRDASGASSHLGHPIGPEDGWPALGATVKVTKPDGATLLRFVDGGNGHSGDSAAQIHVGLGEFTGSDPLKVEVRWRDASAQIQNANFKLHTGWHTVLLPFGMET